MRTITLPGVDRPVSVVVQGAMGLLNLDDDTAFACLDTALESGICAFDTAHIYAFGDRSVDALLGRWINARGVADEVVLMAKGSHPEAPDWELPRVTPEAVAFDVADTLDRMKLDRLDVWSFHRDDRNIDVGGLVDAVNTEIDAGRIGAWGVSNWSSDRIQAAIDHAAANDAVGPIANSAHYSLADQVQPPWDDVVTLTGELGSVDRAWHLESGLPVIAWSALAGGMLSANLSREELAAATDGHLADVYRSYHSEENWSRRARAEQVAQRMGVSLSDVAIAWLLGSPVAAMAIVGGASPDEVRGNAAAAEIELSADDQVFIFDPEETP